MSIKLVDSLRQNAKEKAIVIYDKIVDFNYDREIFCRTHSTPAGKYSSFDIASGHKSDTLLKLISENARPNDTIYDIGAYSGDYALPLSNEHVERVVVAFEPSDMSRRKLEKNLSQTEPDGEIIVKAVGVGDRSKIKKFYESSFRKTSSFNRDDATRWGSNIIKTQLKQVDSLDELSNTLPSPDHIKIDTEGFAPKVLRGSVSIANSERPKFYIEPHNREETNRTRQISEWCSDNSYDMKIENDDAIVCYPDSSDSS